MADGYSHAAAALERVWSGRGSIKEAVLGKHNDALSSKQRRFAYRFRSMLAVCLSLELHLSPLVTFAGGIRAVLS